jgi:hypothetical protein
MKRQAIVLLLFLTSFFNCSNLKQVVGYVKTNKGLAQPEDLPESGPEPLIVTPKFKPRPVYFRAVPQCNNCIVDTEKDVHINMAPLVSPGSKYQGPKLIKLNPRNAMLHPVRRFVIVEEEVHKPANC